MTLSEKIYKLRKEKVITQEELAAQINVSRQAISKWELGESMPDTENIVQLSKLFGVSTDYLLIDEYDEYKNSGNIENIKTGGENITAEEFVSQIQSINNRNIIKRSAVILPIYGIVMILAVLIASCMITSYNHFQFETWVEIPVLFDEKGIRLTDEEMQLLLPYGEIKEGRMKTHATIQSRGLLIEFLRSMPPIWFLLAPSCVSLVIGIFLCAFKIFKEKEKRKRFFWILGSFMILCICFFVAQVYSFGHYLDNQELTGTITNYKINELGTLDFEINFQNNNWQLNDYRHITFLFIAALAVLTIFWVVYNIKQTKEKD